MFTAVKASLLTVPRAQSWPAVFDPLALRTFNLTIAPQDWGAIRFD